MGERKGRREKIERRKMSPEEDRKQENKEIEREEAVPGVEAFLVRKETGYWARGRKRKTQGHLVQ